MKKSWTMRIAVVTLVLVLASACLVSGTFAKYTSKVEGSDNARVAAFKFGSDAVATFDLFNSEFDSDVLGTTSNVDADGDKLIAPGAQGNVDWALTGSAEVDTFITYDLDETNLDSIPIVYLFDDNYYSNVLTGNVYLDLDDHDTDASAINHAAIAEVTITGNVAAMATAMSHEVLAGTDIATDNVDSIEWFWAYEKGTEAGTLADEAGEDPIVAAGDASDTVLGNKQADGTDVTVKLDIAVTFTQID